MNIKNNIFHYATSELSQDAFLCWLFSFALKEVDSDPALKACAEDFLKQFVPELGNENEIWLSNEPERQYKSIDILLTVNDKYKIIIEDKTHTKEHGNQLERYIDTVKSDFANYIVKSIYFKIGFQSDISAIEEAGYMYFGLESILPVIEKYASRTTSEIFTSYYFHLKQWHNDINKYKCLPLCKWSYAQINGFYNSLDKDFCGMRSDYGYVPNQSGGFYGMWFYNDIYRTYNGARYELYLQCEFSNGELKICYKASSQSDTKIDKEVREYFRGKKENDRLNVAEKYGFKKPPQLRGGKTSTLGIYNFDSNNISHVEIKKILFKAIESFKQLIKELDE